MFKDRRDAGRQLAARLLRYKDTDPIVLALPRGGVPVGFEIAIALAVPLDVLIVRKLGAPGEPELGIGAVADGPHPQYVLNENVVREINVSEEYVKREMEAQLQEIRRRQRAYRGGRSPARITDRTAIVVDDGIATGGSIRVALRSARLQSPKRLVLAAPVAPPETLATLAAEADDIVCLSQPPAFSAVGEFYLDFRQTTDEEVSELLERARQGRTGSEELSH